jgi:hypothetical protein
MSIYLLEINAKFNRKELFKEANVLEGYQTFIDPKKNNPIHGLFIKKISDGYGLELSESIQNYFNLIDCRPRFFIQNAGCDLPYHTDRGTLCSFNFILSEDPDPILFYNKKFFYKNALINTSMMHAVIQTKRKRILFKLSVFDKSFNEIKDLLPIELTL